MTRIKTKGLALAVIGLSLFLFVPACLSVAPRSTPAVQVVYPTVVITQYVTQVVATPTITPTPLPTSVSNQTPSVVKVGWDPFTVADLLPSCRLCRVSPARRRCGFCSQCWRGSFTIQRHRLFAGYRILAPGEMVDITKGPWCSGGSLIWKSRYCRWVEGFVPEGNGETYWLLPMPPGTENVVVKDPEQHMEWPEQVAA